MEITLERLIEIFVGKPIKIVNARAENVFGTCKAIYKSDGYPNVHFELTDKTQWEIVPDALREESIEGIEFPGSGFRRRIELDVSLSSVFKRIAALEAESHRMCNELALRLERKIPESCRTFARRQRWISVPNSTFPSELPMFLRKMVELKRMGEHSVRVYEFNHIVQFGFQSFAEFSAAMAELQRAWVREIDIEMQERDSDRIRVSFFAVGVEPDAAMIG